MTKLQYYNNLYSYRFCQSVWLIYIPEYLPDVSNNENFSTTYAEYILLGDEMLAKWVIRSNSHSSRPLENQWFILFKAPINACQHLSEQFHYLHYCFLLQTTIGYSFGNNTSMADLSDTSRWWFNCVWVSVWVSLCVRRHVAILVGAWWMYWLWNFACMSGTVMPTMCQMLVVTQWPK